MKINKRELPYLPGKDKNLDAEKGKEYTVKITVTQEQIQTLNSKFGIDAVPMVEDVVNNEIAQSIASQVSKSIFNQRIYEVSKEELQKSVNLISEFGEGFILTNVGTLIEMTWPELKTIKHDTISTFGIIYKLGKIGNYELYVDPNLRYNDNKLAITTNNFWNYKESEDVTIITEGVGAPNIIVKTKVIIKDPKSKVFSINDLKI